MTGKGYPLIRRSVTIGRGSTCDISPSGYEQLSRAHARISWDGSTFIAEDLGSQNGVQVGDQRTGRSPLANGDRIILGDLELELRVPAGGPQFGDASSPKRRLTESPQRPVWPYVVFGGAVIVVMALGISSRSHSGVTPTGSHQELFSVQEPDGVKGKSVAIVAGTQKISLGGDSASVPMKNNIPQLIASVDSNGKAILLGIMPPGSSVGQLTAQSTAEALVYCTPFLCPAEDQAGRALLTSIKNAPEVSTLAQALTAHESGSLESAIQDPTVKQALAEARTAVSKAHAGVALNRSGWRLATWQSVSPTDEEYGMKAELDTGDKLTIGNGKRHWLVITGLPAGTLAVVPSNPSTIDVGGALAGWQSKMTFDVSTTQTPLRVYAWSAKAPTYINCQPQPGDSRCLLESAAMTLFFDGAVRVFLTGVGDATNWDNSPAAIQVGFDLINDLMQGGLAAGVENEFSNGNYQGALQDISLAVFQAVANHPDALKSIASFLFGDPCDDLSNAIGGLFSTGLLQGLQIADDFAALIVDNAGPAVVLGLTLTPSAPPPPPPPPPIATPTIPDDWYKPRVEDGNPDEDAESLVKRAYTGADGTPYYKSVEFQKDLSAADGDVKIYNLERADRSEEIRVWMARVYNPSVPDSASLAERRSGGHYSIGSVEGHVEGQTWWKKLWPTDDASGGQAPPSSGQ
jgi:hypothetical protein